MVLTTQLLPLAMGNVEEIFLMKRPSSIAKNVNMIFVKIVKVIKELL
jgi:hypothetical protein